MTKPGLVIGGSQQLLTEALELALPQHGFTVLAVTATVAALPRLVQLKRPVLCLVDRQIDGGDAVEVIGELLTCSPRTKVVVLAADGGTDGISRALAAGACGYLHKAHGIATLVSVLRQANAGQIAVRWPLPDTYTTSPPVCRSGGSAGPSGQIDGGLRSP